MNQAKRLAQEAVYISRAMELDSDPTHADDDGVSTESDTEPSWTQVQAASSQLSIRPKPSQDHITGIDGPASGYAWDDPLRRASRWRDEDSCHTFYNNVLKDLGLPTTRSREVANWRIKKRAADGDVFVQEQPSGELRSQRAYDVVMSARLNIRSPYPALVPTPDPLVREHTTPTSVSCTHCRRKLRLCHCYACHKCGELLLECLCQRYSGCNLHNSDCSCTPTMKRNSEEKELITYRTRQWIAANSSPLSSKRSPYHSQRYFTPYELCGTFIILTSAAVYDDLKRSEIVISYSSSNECLYGRYRHGETVHGLFRTNNVPVSASTQPIPCVVAVENAQLQDGTWDFDVAPVGQPFRYPQPEYSSPTHHNGGIPVPDRYDCNGITFLSSNFIVLGSHFLGHRMDLAPEDGQHVVFGLKVSNECDDVQAMIESWNAIHREYCEWYHYQAEGQDAGSEGEGDDSGHFRVYGNGRDETMAGSVEWDEELIDGLVNKLYRQP